MVKEPDVKEGEPPGPVAPPLWPFIPPLVGATGIIWAYFAVNNGIWGDVFGIVPAVLMISPSLSNVFSGGDARLSQFMCLGSFLGVVLSFPMMFVAGIFIGVLLLVLSAASFVAAGYLAVGEDPVPVDVPEPEMGLKLSASAASDEVKMTAIILTTWPHAVGARATRVSREVDEALEMFEHNGWLENPIEFNGSPPPAENVSWSGFKHKGWNMEHLTFESGYEPWPDEPGRDRWLDHKANCTAHALTLRHREEGRPWLVCVHGLRNGSPHKSSDLFQPEFLHEELGMNLLLPYLPRHGPRRKGMVSGSPLLGGDMMELLHAGAQGSWDIRRLLSWLRLPEQSAPAVGVLGHSLGGYTAALLAGLSDDIDGVVSANPSVDPSHMFWRDGLSAATRYLKTNGTTQKKSDKLLSVVSPMSFEPRVPKEGRAIIASVADRIIPPSEPHSLWQHWDRPRVLWHQGTHFGLLRTGEGREAVKETLRDAGVLR
ncbi:MAG: alpha/beta fold hydrolase [Rubrobacteraceae bacterium]